MIYQIKPKILALIVLGINFQLNNAPLPSGYIKDIGQADNDRVTDGKLTIDAQGDTNSKLNYIAIAGSKRPSVRTINLTDSQTNVSPDISITADVNSLLWKLRIPLMDISTWRNSVKRLVSAKLHFCVQSSNSS